MKKVLCCFIVILMSLILCCCKTETNKVKENGEPLSDGTKTYYINEFDDNDRLIHKTRYNNIDSIIEDYEYDYSYDINGILYKMKETNILNGKYNETNYNKFKEKTEKIYYNKNGKILCKYDYLKNGYIKKKYIYKNGMENGYILYDYYTDNQIKSETEYLLTGKTKRIKTYYKGKLLYQIKDYNDSGFICKIKKYSYDKEKIIKESIYDGDFNLIQVTDYTKNPKEIIKYDKKENTRLN